MADTTQTLSLITLAQLYRGDVIRQVNRTSALLSMVPIVRGEGKNCAWVPASSGMIAENFAEGADAANFGSDAQASAVLSWGQYRANFHVSGLALAASRSSSSPMGNVALWARNLVDASTALTSKLNADLFSGAGTGTLLAGLDVAIANDANIYAGIDRSSVSYWRPTVVDPGALTDPTFALIRDDMRKIYEASGEMPDVAFCSPAVFNKIGGLFDATRRQVDQVMTARGLIRLSAGFSALEIDGMFIMKDKDATANRLYYINTNHVRVEYLMPDSPTAAEPGVAALAASDGMSSMSLPFQYEFLAKAGDSKKAQVKTYLQLVVDKPNSCGCRKNVNA